MSKEGCPRCSVKDAALRELRDLLPEHTEETEEGVRLNIAATIDAALSDGGEGWLPPEVK